MDCGFVIHRSLGPGLLESAYEHLMELALTKRGLHVARQQPISLEFEGAYIENFYVHQKQLPTYLRITNKPLGLLMNFGEAMLKDGIRRVINNQSNYIAPLHDRDNRAT